MKAILEDGKSIFLQIAEAVEDDILCGLLSEEELIPSKNQFATHYSINPATAAKGVNLLVDEGVVYKKRGIGMCVTTGAREIICSKRKSAFYKTYVASLIQEAAKLEISKADLIKMIEKGENDE